MTMNATIQDGYTEDMESLVLPAMSYPVSWENWWTLKIQN